MKAVYFSICPSTGSKLTDTYTASSHLGEDQFSSHHRYSVLWEPGEFVRWYLNDELLFEVNKEALRGQVGVGSILQLQDLAGSCKTSIEERM